MIKKVISRQDGRKYDKRVPPVKYAAENAMLLYVDVFFLQMMCRRIHKMSCNSVISSLYTKPSTSTK